MSDDDATGEGRERFAPVDDQYDPDAVEPRVFDHWEAANAYERTVEHRSDGEEFFFVDGPPYTSGAAHMGTTWNKVLKDLYIRYHRMQGYDVTDRPGYDMHGLPIETKVEEQLGFENKKDIEEFGEQAFIEECKAFAQEQLVGLQEDFQDFGVWMDWDEPYRTVTPEYMEAAWWGFSQAHERGLVEQGKRSINQCPRCETAIANNEVEYHDVDKPSIYVRFPLRETSEEASDGASGDAASEGRKGSLVIWTTTPWTIVANTFVAVDSDLTYVGVDAKRSADGSAETETETDRLYVAEACLEEVLKAGRYDDYEVVEKVTGEEMVGWNYDHPLAEEVPDHPQGEGAGQVYTAEYVEADRTGLVHSAPGHGEEDFERGQELDLEVFCPVDSDGVYTDQAGAYAGTFVREANNDIIADLDGKGALVADEETGVREGQCWRCNTDIVRVVTDQWFITITDIKQELLANIEDAQWHPEWARDNRFRDFVEDAPDWNVSRQRYWGIPIPIWTPSADSSGNGDADGWDGDMDEVIVISDRAELAERADQAVDPESVDLHKGTVDELTITEDGTTYTRVGDVFDVWLDSSVATWGTVDYPSETGDFEELWPADLIIEAHDQTRGWFWSQLGMGTAAVDQSPYEEVLMHGYANMPDGRGMSKSKGILVDPGEVIAEYGRDPMRLFLLSVTAQGEDMNFSWEETEEMQRRLNILWNVARFPMPYMRTDGFEPDVAAEPQRDGSGEAADGTSLADVEGGLELVDEWVLSRLQSVEATMTEHMDAFENHKAVEALLDFVVEDVSRFYIQVVRERMWEAEDSASKRAAYATLYRVLEEVAALFAPFAPFVAEEVYGALTGEAGHPTVHMCDWPDPDERLRDPGLEDEVEVVRAVEEAGSNARQQAERKLRWPVSRVVVDVDSEAVAAAVETRANLVADRLNARAVEVLGPDEEWGELRYSAAADMSELGPAFGEDAGRVMEALNDARVAEPTLDALKAAVSETLAESAEQGSVDAAGGQGPRGVELTEEMVEVRRETPPEVAGVEFAAEDGGGVVYVDTALTEDIESEGYAREVVRRVQEMRKELDLDIETEVRLDLDIGDDRVAGLVERHTDYIEEEVRAGDRGTVENGHRKTWDVEGVEVEIGIEPCEADRREASSQASGE